MQLPVYIYIDRGDEGPEFQVEKKEPYIVYLGGPIWPQPNRAEQSSYSGVGSLYIYGEPANYLF